jgi:hypothetical protein
VPWLEHIGIPTTFPHNMPDPVSVDRRIVILCTANVYIFYLLWSRGEKLYFSSNAASKYHLITFVCIFSAHKHSADWESAASKM